MTMYASVLPVSLPRDEALTLGIQAASQGRKVELLFFSYVDLGVGFQEAAKQVNEWDVAQISRVPGNQFIHYINEGELRFAVMAIPNGFRPDLAIRVEEDATEARGRLLRHLDQLDRDAEKRARRAH